MNDSEQAIKKLLALRVKEFQEIVDNKDSDSVFKKYEKLAENIRVGTENKASPENEEMKEHEAYWWKALSAEKPDGPSNLETAKPSSSLCDIKPLIEEIACPEMTEKSMEFVE